MKPTRETWRKRRQKSRNNRDDLVTYAALLAALPALHGAAGAFARLFGSSGVLFWNRSARLRFPSYGKSEKSGRAVIPEPSFGFFLRAMGAMLLLVIIMTAYFSLRA